jgi:hypothetical protein
MLIRKIERGTFPAASFLDNRFIFENVDISSFSTLFVTLLTFDSPTILNRF